MKRSCENLSPMPSDFFLLTDTFNKETGADAKTKILEEINAIVHSPKT